MYLATATHNLKCETITHILFNFRSNIYESWGLNKYFIPNDSD